MRGQLIKGKCLAAALALIAAPIYLQIARAQQDAPVPAATAPITLATSAASERALLDQYCVTCHNQRLKTAGLTLDQLDIAQMHDHAEVWEKVVRKLRAGMMPPSGMRRPDAPVMESMITFLEKELDRDAVPYLTPPGMHRLNRTEYTNAIRDVLGLQVDATKFLPPDDSTHGFDNIAGALTLSPALMEAYLSAAGKISRLAIGDVSAPTQAVFEVPADTAQNYHIEGLPFGTRGGILIKYQFPADGEYTFKVKGVTGYFQAVLGGVKGEQARSHGGRRAREAVRLGQGNCEHHRQGPLHATHPGQGRPAHRRRDVPCHQRRAGQRTEQTVSADHEHAGLHPGISVLSARRPGLD